MADLPDIDFKAIIEIHGKIMENFPDSAWMLDTPELSSILIEAVTQDLSPAIVQSRFRETQWFQTRSDAERQWDALEATDPATTAKQIEARTAELTSMATQLGIQNMDRMSELAERSLREGLNQEQIQDMLAPLVNISSGKVQTSITDIRALGYEYGINVSEAERLRMARDVVIGDTTVDDIRKRLAEQAKQQHPHLAEQIDRGLLPGQYFSPHREIIANALGQSVEAIDLFGDPRWAEVVSKADGGDVRPMTLAEVTQMARSTEEFGNSRQGQAEGAAFAQEIGRMLAVKRG